jgi:hypothetical protein
MHTARCEELLAEWGHAPTPLMFIHALKEGDPLSPTLFDFALVRSIRDVQDMQGSQQMIEDTDTTENTGARRHCGS